MLHQLPSTTQRTTFDIDSVSYAHFFYKNQWGEERELKPSRPTVNGVAFNPEDKAIPLPGFTSETMLARVTRIGSLDRWTPRIVLTMKNGHKLIYNGEKAVSINQAWKAKVYGKDS